MLHERVPPSQVDTARDWLHDNLLCYEVELVEFDPSMAADVLGPSRPFTYFLFDLVLVLVLVLAACVSARHGFLSRPQAPRAPTSSAPSASRVRAKGGSRTASIL